MTKPSLVRTALLIAGLATAMPAPLGAQAATRTDALALEQSGHPAEAQQLWQKLAEQNARDPEALAHLGLLEARQQHFEAAIGFYRKGLALDRRYPGLNMNLGLACFKAGQFPGAIEAFQAELRLHQDNPATRDRLTILLGMSHYGMADYLVAIPYLERAAQREAGNLPLRLALAHSCLWSKQFPCVLDTAREILSIDPNSAEADMLTGEALDEQGESVSAIEQFRAAAKADPAVPNVHFGLGYLLWKQNQFSSAIEQFREELKNDPSHVQARIYLADALVATGAMQQAEPELLQAVAAAPMSAMVQRDLGALYAAQDDPSRALEHFQQAIVLDPKDVASHLRLAKLYRATGDRERSREQSEIASRITKTADSASDALMQKLPQQSPSRP